jgi:drug/metabolite transporter (DMT)-like permease
MASISALFLALVGLLGQLATRELSVFPALFLRYLASTLVIFSVLRGEALPTLRNINRLDWLRVGSVLISQFCLFYYLSHGSLLVGMLLYNTGPLFSPILARLLLGITFGACTVVSLALGFAGVTLVLNPFGERLDGTVLVALASGFFNSCSQLAFHQVSGHEESPSESLSVLHPAHALLDSAARIRRGRDATAISDLGQWHALAVILGLGIFGVLNQAAKSMAYRNVQKPRQPRAVSLPLTPRRGSLRLDTVRPSAKRRDLVGRTSHPCLGFDHSLRNTYAPQNYPRSHRMKPTALDRQTALVVIDLQKGITRLPTIHPVGPVVANAARLVAGFRLQTYQSCSFAWLSAGRRSSSARGARPTDLAASAGLFRFREGLGCQ